MGAFGEVFKAQWNGSTVAVKNLIRFSAAELKQFAQVVCVFILSLSHLLSAGNAFSFTFKTPQHPFNHGNGFGRRRSSKFSLRVLYKRIIV